ncbi:DUF2777 family protein [Ferdinandcohnia sp. Marseille-Q9671]
MDLQQRLGSINEQQRSFVMGTTECINDQWIFFDAETDEASMLEEMIGKEVEVFTLNKWEKGLFVEDGLIQMCDYFYKLENGDCLRFRKRLNLAYKELLESFSEDQFLRFTSTLNKLSFSLYDCIHCHNQLMYLQEEDVQNEGVNFLLFDNTDLLLSIHHHFTRGKLKKDRFEFTLANGKRAILSTLYK